MEAEPFLLGLRLAGRRCVVAGGGAVALRRVGALLDAGAQVLVVAPEVTASLEDLAERGALQVERRAWADGDAAGAWLVLACTSDAAVNARVAAEAERARVWCLRADDAMASTAWMPATGRTGPFTVAVHAGGDPRRAAAARRLAVEALTAAPPPPVRQAATGGRVVIVGGGPGEPGLITMRGLQRLLEAQVVVTDRLAPLALLDDLDPSVTIIDAAKVPGGRAMPQEEINRHLVDHALAGQVVVRLKGGDPFVLGRGMEEVEACAVAGVPVEVVPGVTSAVAVPGLAGIPVTHRGVSQSFTVVSGHVPPGDPQSGVNWSALARSGSTLVLLMAVRTLRAIAAALVEGGMPASTPVACVPDGGATVFTDLAGVLTGTAAAVRPPAIIVVGEVVRVGQRAPTERLVRRRRIRPL